MRASRLLSIQILLQLRGRVSAEELAREFEVSVRTIYRDIDQLSAAGVPVYAERGRAGGFALLDGYRTRLTGFSSGEAETLLLAGAGRAASDLGLGEQAAIARLKLLASLPAETGEHAQRIALRFHLDPVGWYQRADTGAHLREIALAVWSDRRIRIRYESWEREVERRLDPLGLVLKAGAWYLVAASKGEPRTYRVSNIRAFTMLDETFQRPRSFDLDQYWRRGLDQFEARLFSARAVVKVSPLGLKRLREASPVAAEAMAAAATPCAPKGWVEGEIPVEGDAQAIRLFLQLGAEAAIVSPLRLRHALAEEAQRIARLNRRVKADQRMVSRATPSRRGSAPPS
jgi:predicted DNA-binding transcriptional regulator YafY